MGLPPKSYFHLTEIAERWDASIADLACYTLDGLLEISIMAIGIRVEIGSFEADDRGLFRIPEEERVLHGPHPVVSSDLWPVFRTGSGTMRRFKPSAANTYCDIASDLSDIQVQLGDLLVTRAERHRFETTHGLNDQVPTDVSKGALIAESEFIERNDYSEVVLNGEIFRLGILQAAIVRELHRASQTENPWRHGKEILSKCNAQTMRMVDLFKSKGNWRSLIASDNRGKYRLNISNRPTPRPSHRAYRRLFARAS